MGDETALVNTYVRGRSYAPAEKTHVTLAVGGTRQKLSMIATGTNKSEARWMIIDLKDAATSQRKPLEQSPDRVKNISTILTLIMQRETSNLTD